MQFLRQDETLSLSFASLVMVDYTYKYNIQDLFKEEVNSYSPKKLTCIFPPIVPNTKTCTAITNREVQGLTGKSL
jgi:hypothetical protein